ncbi:MAG: TIGR00730 family Rossman fold protein [Thermoleophilia bacterium]|nr:TIGR00730 family Rossman fold protein [Thermoleophilia bacterium]
MPVDDGTITHAGRNPRAVAVYCGSSPGADPAYRAAAEELGRTLAARRIRLVYGGGAVGLMGAVADAALGAGGDVLGVITRALVGREVGHRGLPAMEVVETMHARKARMVGAADAVVVLPGGMGTMDELFEAATWTQLGIHRVPCGVLDVGGYYAPLAAWLDRAVGDRFLPAAQRGIVSFHSDIPAMLDHLARWTPPCGDKWLDRSPAP